MFGLEEEALGALTVLANLLMGYIVLRGKEEEKYIEREDTMQAREETTQNSFNLMQQFADLLSDRNKAELEHFRLILTEHKNLAIIVTELAQAISELRRDYKQDLTEIKEMIHNIKEGGEDAL